MLAGVATGVVIWCSLIGLVGFLRALILQVVELRLKYESLRYLDIMLAAPCLLLFISEAPSRSGIIDFLMAVSEAKGASCISGPVRLRCWRSLWQEVFTAGHGAVSRFCSG